MCRKKESEIIFFKNFRSSFPALTKLTVYLNGVSNFVETDFIDLIGRQKSTLSNLRMVDIRFPSKNVGRMTGRSLLAILRTCSNLKSFENFLYFPISSKDRVNLFKIKLLWSQLKIRSYCNFGLSIHICRFCLKDFNCKSNQITPESPGSKKIIINLSADKNPI